MLADEASGGTTGSWCCRLPSACAVSQQNSAATAAPASSAGHQVAALQAKQLREEPLMPLRIQSSLTPHDALPTTPVVVA